MRQKCFPPREPLFAAAGMVETLRRMLAAGGRLQREVLLAVVDQVLQLGAEGVEMLLLLDDDVLTASLFSEAMREASL